MAIIRAQSQSHEKRLCCCGQRVTSELLYAEDVAQNASPVGLSSGTPPLSPSMDLSYQTPPLEQAATLVPIPEEVQLPSPNMSEEEVVRVPPPHAPSLGHQVGGQRCWTCRKPDESLGAGAARLFRSSTGIRRATRPRPYALRQGSSVRGAGSWHVRGVQHLDASEPYPPSSRFHHDRVGNLSEGADHYGWKTVLSFRHGGAELGGASSSGSGASGSWHLRGGCGGRGNGHGLDHGGA